MKSSQQQEGAESIFITYEIAIILFYNIFPSIFSLIHATNTFNV